MNTTNLLSCGHELNLSPEGFGELRRSDTLLKNPEALRARMKEDGYLYLPGCLDRQEVMKAREAITDRLAAEGWFDPNQPAIEAVIKPGCNLKFRPDLAKDNAPLNRVLYAGRMIELYERLLDGAIRHFDYTWLRAVAPGRGTNPHTDIVYMGRGTKNLYTSWTPLGDVPLDVGGLIILENSHRQSDKLRPYLERDVDTYCANHPDANLIASGQKTWQWDGSLTDNPVSLREKLGGRWLTAEFRTGDVLIFGMATVHASLDNRSNRARLSSDSRYQLASEPADERWIGPNPIAHGVAGKRGRIC